MNRNVKAFLDMIANSEIGPALLAVSDNGYNVVVGSTPRNPTLFTSYARHPALLVDLGNGLKSTAAGRYQLLKRYYDAYKASLYLPDFSPASQDAIAIQQIKECKALDDIVNGDFAKAVAKCSHIWASLPGAGYGQHENQLAALQQAYMKFGGTIA
jgi:muramidase (phage lysozyme)